MARLHILISTAFVYVLMLSHAQGHLRERNATSNPRATVTNGTYTGIYSPGYDQEFFLGIPFAQPPIGDLRFRVPQPLNESFNGTRYVTTQPNACVGNQGTTQPVFPFSEDCLYLNIVRPAGYKNMSLPIAVWIHGGGFYAGRISDQTYNTSFIVNESVAIGRPIIAVSISYRLSAWGFLASDEVMGSGNTNLGLRDQRLALHWIKENIAAFGGDADKVTVFGESAGACSIGFQIMAYRGRDDKLFRAAVMQSGSPVFSLPLNGSDWYQPLYNELTARVGCRESWDTLECLRKTAFEVLHSAISQRGPGITDLTQPFIPSIDGDIVPTFASLQMAHGQFLKVPIILGATTDEGTLFAPRGMNTTEEFYHTLVGNWGYVAANFPPDFAKEILRMYPDDTSVGSGAGLPPDFRPGPPYGAQFRRVASYYGDTYFMANRRLTCQSWAKHGVPAYCYRFNTKAAGWPQEFGVAHSQDIAFVFNNIGGYGYENEFFGPPIDKNSSRMLEVARLMSRSWISFVHDLDPNSFRVSNDPNLWPKYRLDSPQNFVFDGNTSSYVEPDTWRSEALKLISDNNAGLYKV